MTSGRIFDRPLSVQSAQAYVDEWLSLPVVTVVVPGAGHWPILRNLLAQTGTGGNLVTDAHIAALALGYGYAVYSSDNDGMREPWLTEVSGSTRGVAV
jgi:predicted nucleic acid-binding protein